MQEALKDETEMGQSMSGEIETLSLKVDQLNNDLASKNNLLESVLSEKQVAEATLAGLQTQVASFRAETEAEKTDLMNRVSQATARAESLLSEIEKIGQEKSDLEQVGTDFAFLPPSAACLWMSG